MLSLKRDSSQEFEMTEGRIIFFMIFCWKTASAINRIFVLPHFWLEALLFLIGLSPAAYSGRFRKRILKDVKNYWIQRSIGKALEQIPRDLLRHPEAEHRLPATFLLREFCYPSSGAYVHLSCQAGGQFPILHGYAQSSVPAFCPALLRWEKPSLKMRRLLRSCWNLRRTR